MRSAAFLARQWPKRHAHLVEECVAAGRVLHVGGFLPRLDAFHRALLWDWQPPGAPSAVRLVARMGGPFKRWWLRCPRCGRTRDALYRPPECEGWACRLCHGLIYASQRHGPRHPLSRVLTERKRSGRLQAVLAQGRRWARRAIRPGPGVPDSAEEAAIAGLGALGVRRPAAPMGGVPMRADQEAQARAVAARIAAEAERSLAVLRRLAESASSKRVRAGARRSLSKYARPEK